MRITHGEFLTKRGSGMKKVSWMVVVAGLAVGIAAVVLTLLGNPSRTWAFASPAFCAT